MRPKNGRGGRGWLRPLVLACGLILIPAIGASQGHPAAAQSGHGPLRALLPADGEISGWTREGEVQEYAGEDLYLYIDGGAEIYHEYGFRRVVLQDYRNAAGKSVSLEIFEMETPEAAYGIFTFKRSGKGKAVALGSGAEIEDYYLNAWKDRYLITLTGFDEAAETVAGLRAIAVAVALKIPDAGDPPDLLADLPAERLKPGSVKYLKGLLGLNAIYSFYSARGLSFVEAVKGDYENDATLLLLDYGTTGALDQAVAELGRYLADSDRFKRQAGTALTIDSLVIVDGRGRFLAFGRRQTRLYVGIGAVKDTAVDIVRRARR